MKSKQIGIFGNFEENKEKYLEELKSLYNLGLNDTLIGKKLGLTNTLIRTYRNKLGLPKIFEYKRKFDTKLFIKLYEQGLSYGEIARQLKISSSAASDYARSLGLSSNYLSYPELEFTETEFQVFLGTIYGDAYIGIPSDSRNARGHFAHSLKLQNYCIWKYEQLKRFCSEPKLRLEYDKRNGATYYSIDVSIKSNPIFTKIYPKIYNNRVKYINEELLNKISPLGIAVWFMDDGYYDHESYSIATNCFNINDLNIILKVFKDKFNLTFTIHSNNIIRLRKFDSQKFINLIKPYIHPDCLYKLHLDPQKTPLNGETPKMDNPVLNLLETKEKSNDLK